MKKFIAVAGIVAVTASAALAGTASAAAPANPGGFGQERSSNIHEFFTNDGLGNWGQWSDGAAARAGDNANQNHEWMVDHDYLPAGVTPGQ